MKIKPIIFLLFCSVTAIAQNFKYPSLLSQGKNIKSLIPAQWKIVDSVSGDLNGDQDLDLALVLEFYAAVKENRAYGDNETDLITELQRPRILAVYFKSGKNYKLALQNNHFVLRADEGGGMGDPLRPMAISKNRLVLNYEGGSNWKWKLNYNFKYTNGEWQLTNAGNCAFHDASGKISDRSYDFVNRKITIKDGSSSDKITSDKTEHAVLPAIKLRTFTTFKKPWTWQVRPGEFL